MPDPRVDHLTEVDADARVEAENRDENRDAVDWLERKIRDFARREDVYVPRIRKLAEHIYAAMTDPEQ